LICRAFDGAITRFCARIRILSGIFPAFPVPERGDVRLLIWSDVISRTVETLLGPVQTRSNLRVEWYIVLLIVADFG
jgi:hypothetical protein